MPVRVVGDHSDDQPAHFLLPLYGLITSRVSSVFPLVAVMLTGEATGWPDPLTASRQRAPMTSA